MPPAPRDLRRPLANYYTPPALARAAVQQALELPLRHFGPLSLRVLDPACGSGNLLQAARELLSGAAALQLGGLPQDYFGRVERNLTGVDLDPGAIRTAKERFPEGSFEVADALRHPWGTELYSVVVANPPFYNPMRSDQRRAESAHLHSLHPELGGGADTAAHFAWLALRLSGSRGSGSVILPRALFSSPAVLPWRALVTPRITSLYAPQRSEFFEGASVYVGVAAWGPEELSAPVRLSTDNDPSAIVWRTGGLTPQNWWGALQGLEMPDLPGSVRLGGVFEVEASLGMSQAYDLKDCILDQEDGTDWKLLTTGLIDPGRARWGEKRSVNFGKRYRHPRIPRNLEVDTATGRKLARARRPKVLVAGLTSAVECFLDPAGEYLGTVTTWTLTHPQDSVEELSRLQHYLSSPAVSVALRVELGASAYGSSINISKPWLSHLPLPWDPLRDDGALAWFTR